MPLDIVQSQFALLDVRTVAPEFPDHLNPARCSQAPVVEVPKDLNPFADRKVRLFLWLAAMLPLGNLKFYPAFMMLLRAALSGALNGVHTLVEASSGNMAYALAILAPYFGIKRVVFLVPADMPASKRERLYLAGVRLNDLTGCTELPGEPTAIEIARTMGRQDGWINLGQYDNLANPEAHSVFTAASIWKQTHRGTTVVAAGRGTNGTVVGLRDFFRHANPRCIIVGPHCKEGNPVPGVRPRSRLVDGFDWEDGTVSIAVGQKDAYRTSLQFVRRGFPVGPAAGLAIAGLRDVIELASQTDTLDHWRNPDGDVVGVVVCGDGPELYVDKYSTVLDAQDL